jgi:hypothetical protein
MAIVVHSLFDGQGRQVVPAETLVEIWRTIVRENKVELLFYAGGINTPAEFLEFITAPRLTVSVVIESNTGHILGLAWLTNASQGSAFVHYCMLGPPRRDVGKALVSHWCGLRDGSGSPLFDVLLGVTPEFHTAALRVVRIMGFTTLGTIPRYCRSPYAGGACGGVISYYECPSGRV